MKAIIAIPLSIVWLALSGGYLFLIANVKIDQPQSFKADNVSITFNYPSGWKAEVQGDLTTTTSDKLIILSDKLDQYSIIIRQRIDKPSTKVCVTYNDCEFQNINEYFSFSESSFELLNTKHNLYISKTGGTDYIWDNNGNTTLLSAQMKVGYSYEVYYKTDNNKLNSDIKLDNNVIVQIAYQFDKELAQDKFDELKAALKLVISTLNS